MISQTELVLNLIESVRSTNSIDEVLEIFISLTKKIFDYKWCSLYMLNEDSNMFEKRVGRNPSLSIDTETKRMIDEGIIDWVINERYSKIIPAKALKNGRGGKSNSHLNFIITPLLAGRKGIGAFIILVNIPEEKINQECLTRMFLLANQTAFAIENNILCQDMAKRIAELQILFESSKNINRTIELVNLLVLILNMAKDVINTEYSVIFLKDGEALRPIESIGINKDGLKNIKINIGTGISGLIARERQPILIKDYKSDIRFKLSPCILPIDIKNALGIPLIARNEITGVLILYNTIDKESFSDDNFRMLNALAGHAGIAIERASLYERLNQGYFDTITALANAVEAKDPYTIGHSSRVTQYALEIAKGLSLSKRDIEILKYAGILHDIGKIGIPETILLKPARLTDKEFNIIQKHPALGEDIIKSVTFLKDICPVIRHHHEYVNGKGYPNRLKGEEIPFLSKVLSVADAYDAMTSDRPYRQALPKEAAIEELRRFSYHQFDFAIVTTFINILVMNIMKIEDSQSVMMPIRDILIN